MPTRKFFCNNQTLAKCDVLLAKNLQSAKEKPKCVTHFSNNSQNELIDLLGETIKKNLIFEIKNAKYFTLILDSTTEIGREDQLSKILRYVHIDENRNVEIKETCLGFFQNRQKRYRKLDKKILQKLEKDKTHTDYHPSLTSVVKHMMMRQLWLE